MYQFDLIVTLETNLKNIFSCSIYWDKTCNERKKLMPHSLIFHSFWLVPSPACLFFEILCVSVVPFSLSLCTSLPLLHTHLRLRLLFSILLGSPSTLSPYLFFPFSPLSPAPLLSPSERLRIPKGADAIKMLILSVYRERERGADSMRDCGSHGELDWNGE